MPRRVTLPGASELFRRTEAPQSVQPGAPPPARASKSTPTTPAAVPAGEEITAEATPTAARQEPDPGHTGRVRHDEKMTVYVSATELVALEQSRLTLRAEHALKVDRGRIVRAAVAMALTDLDERGADSELVRQLRAQ